ncbi:FtsK/SpoIIIE domain-containing protein [Mycobacterium intracellulare]|uniref:FtsK/SpoIIIE domain-containing protein n=1 Tax=Mycobacterium intracellulare TaxID=1767 RepID=UPI001446CF31|nr:FtsK/SpoIIIE domain-containing protein [Mycobacterium intracellulare]
MQLGTALDSDEPVWLDLRDTAYGGHGCHGLLVGSGSGAAQLWQSMVMSLACTYSPEALRIWLVLPGLEAPEHAERMVEAVLAVLPLRADQQEMMRKGAAYQRRWGEEVLLLSALPHVENVIGTRDGGAWDAQRLRQCLHNEIDRRTTVLCEAKCGDRVEFLARHGQDSAVLPALVVFVDGFLGLIRADPRIEIDLRRVAAAGQALGIHLMLGTGKLDAVAASSCYQLVNFRIVFQADSTDLSYALGRGVVRLPGPEIGYLQRPGELVGFHRIGNSP